MKKITCGKQYVYVLHALYAMLYLYTSLYAQYVAVSLISAGELHLQPATDGVQQNFELMSKYNSPV